MNLRNTLRFSRLLVSASSNPKRSATCFRFVDEHFPEGFSLGLFAENFHSRIGGAKRSLQNALSLRETMLRAKVNRQQRTSCSSRQNFSFLVNVVGERGTFPFSFLRLSPSLPLPPRSLCFPARKDLTSSQEGPSPGEA